MLLTSWLRSLTNRPSRSVRRAASKPRRPLVWAPAVEHLEDRTLLSAVTVTTASDVVDAKDGVTSLREAAQVFDAEITFDAALTGQTINIGAGGQIAITSHVTITGTTAGAGTTQLTISGNELSRLFSVGTGKSLEITGLTLTGGTRVLPAVGQSSAMERWRLPTAC